MSEMQPEDDIYVCLYPFSNANPSKYHRVVLYADWMRYTNDKMTGDLHVYAQRNSFEEAQDACDLLNAKVET